MQIEVQNVDASGLSPNPWNPNSVGPEMELRLEESIRRFGLYKPIITRELPGGGLQILGGEHRWRAARRLGMATVPVVNLGPIDDARAKAIGLADNGRYGEDDALRLGAILRELGEGDVISFLPMSEQDLAGIFAAESIDLDDMGIDDHEDPLPDASKIDPLRPTLTHALMRFKVPIEDQARVEQLIQAVIKKDGLASEDDSMVAAGMALVRIVNAAREVL